MATFNSISLLATVAEAQARAEAEATENTPRPRGCCGVGCVVDPEIFLFNGANADYNSSRHWCTKCDAPCCGICASRNADSANTNELSKRVICNRHPASSSTTGSGNANAEGNANNATATQPRSVTPDPGVGNPLPLELTAAQLRKVSRSNVVSIARSIDLKKKDSITKDFPPLKPKNVRQTLRPPIHITGGHRDWVKAIACLYIWNKVFTKEDQKRELAKARQNMTNPLKLEYTRNIKFLMNNRPNTVQDLAPEPQRVSERIEQQRIAQEVSTREAAHDARVAEGNSALQRLIQNEIARTGNRDVQIRVCIDNNLPVPPPPGTAVAAAEQPLPIGRFSNESDRQEEAHARQEARRPKKMRKIGENAKSLGQQADRKAMETVNRLIRVQGDTIDTLHYPGIAEGDLMHETVVIVSRGMKESHSRGGQPTAQPLERPVIEIYARSQAVVDHVFGNVAISAEAQRNGTQDSCPVDYRTHYMQPNETFRQSMNKKIAKWLEDRKKGRVHNETHASVLGELESDGRSNNQMSPARHAH